MRPLTQGVGALIAVSLALTAPNAAARRWAAQTSPRSSLLDGLDAVSCPHADACTAVGSSSMSGSIAAERWDGKRWRVARLPTSAATMASELNGVSCVSSVACEAVGFSQTGSISAGATVPLGERWDGSRWTRQTVPPPGTVANLTAVSCAAVSSCVAVGNWGDDLDQALFAERWNGRRWSPLRMRTPAGGQAIEINGVSCPATRDCIAVGSYTPTDGHQTPLAERWDGRRWLIEKTADPSRRLDTTLSSVSCSSRRECVAVGKYSALGSESQVPVAEQRNGGLWALYSLPGTAGVPLLSASLAGVSCLPGGPCSAVGTAGATGPGGPGGQTLAERWLSTNWFTTPTPSPAPSTELLAVSCPSPATCVAVGDQSDMAGENPSVLIERLS